MQSSPRHSSFATRHSRGEVARFAFTLLELLIAIFIIAVLAGLILTVASSASIKAHNAQVTADIQSLVAGVAAFKQQFGVEPPSSITLYETHTAWAGDSRSMGLIRQIWPQFDFTIDRDINGDSNTTETISLSGAECLVFFLGGIPALNTPTTPATVGGAPMGFSQNPSDPFSRSGTTNRQSFQEFNISRLFVYSTQTQNMNTYVDPLSGQKQPYLYLSSYGGQGYNVSGELSTPPLGTFVDIYRQGPNGSTATPPSTPWNANSFQIISPGGDQQYGLGGEYESGDPKGLLVGTRGVERDNITNFSSGVLAP